MFMLRKTLNKNNKQLLSGLMETNEPKCITKTKVSKLFMDMNNLVHLFQWVNRNNDNTKIYCPF